MAEIYNTTQLTQGANIVEWLVIFNSWSGGLLMSVFIFGFSLLTLAVMLRSDVDFDVAFISTTFVWFLISLLCWLIQFQNMRLLPTAVPVIFAVFCGIGMFAKMVRMWLNG